MRRKGDVYKSMIINSKSTHSTGHGSAQTADRDDQRSRRWCRSLLYKRGRPEESLKCRGMLKRSAVQSSNESVHIVFSQALIISRFTTVNQILLITSVSLLLPKIWYSPLNWRRLLISGICSVQKLILELIGCSSPLHKHNLTDTRWSNAHQQIQHYEYTWRTVSDILRPLSLPSETDVNV